MARRNHQLLAEAAEKGSQKAMEKLAADMLFGYNSPQNVKAAVSLYKILEKGSHKGQTSYHYWLGINVPKICEVALINYKKVTNFKYKVALKCSHQCQRKMERISILKCPSAEQLKNLTKTEQILSSAHRKKKNEDMPVEKVRLMGRPESLNFNAEFLHWELHQYCTFLAERGDTKIPVYLGQLHLVGRRGLERDHSKAFYCFLKAANAGNANGMAFLGKLYRTVELGGWSKKILTGYFAYQSGNIDSLVQYALAEMGYEVAQSNSAYIMESEKVKLLQRNQIYPLALLLWRRAASQGNAFARVKTRDYYFCCFGTTKDYATAAVHYNLAANQQSTEAMFNLAYMYDGLGIPQDRRWYGLAAETNPDAIMPVFLAYIRLEAMHVLTYLPLVNVSLIYISSVCSNSVSCRVIRSGPQHSREALDFSCLFSVYFDVI
ncbi:LOW QUALITY PROTEIN: protein sel-1 homolog 2 [Liasis olivaceus]